MVLKIVESGKTEMSFSQPGSGVFFGGGGGVGIFDLRKFGNFVILVSKY